MLLLTQEFQTKLQEFIKEVNERYKSDMANYGFRYKPEEDTVDLVGGSKYLKLEKRRGGVWGFVSTVDGTLHGAPVKVGDLLKAATYKAPAKHARGNILDGTAKYSWLGPDYL